MWLHCRCNFHLWRILAIKTLGFLWFDCCGNLKLSMIWCNTQLQSVRASFYYWYRCINLSIFLFLVNCIHLHLYIHVHWYLISSISFIHLIWIITLCYAFAHICLFVCVCVCVCVWPKDIRLHVDACIYLTCQVIQRVLFPTFLFIWLSLGSPRDLSKRYSKKLYLV